MKKHSQLARIRFATSGIQTAWRQERSFRTEVFVLIGVVGYLVWKRAALYWWMAIGFAAALALMAELINTAIENICDAVHPGRHPMIGAAKDCASGAVMVANGLAITVLSAFVWTTW